MKKLIPILFLIPLFSRAITIPRADYTYLDRLTTDDTQALQAQMADGNVTLSKPIYYVSSTLTNTYNLYLNGYTIVYSGTGSTIYMVSGLVHGPGIIRGLDHNFNTSGPSGIAMTGANTAIVGVHFTNFESYGAYGEASNPKIDSCIFDNIPYFDYSFYGASNTTGGTFTHNVCDMSMIASPQGNCVGIRGSDTGLYVTKKWIVAYNTFKTKLNPATENAGGIEVRWCNSLRIFNNIYNGGYLGQSLVACKNIHTYNNKAYNTSGEGYESAGCRNYYSNNDFSSGGPLGILFDNGTVGATITGFQCTNAQGANLATGQTQIAFNQCYFKVTTQGIYITNSTYVNVNNCTFNGNNTGDTPITIESTINPNFVMNSGNVTGFHYCLVNMTGNSQFNFSNVNTNDVVLTSTASGLGLYNATPDLNVSVQ